jgi:cystathionine beta-lyase
VKNRRTSGNDGFDDLDPAWLAGRPGHKWSRDGAGVLPAFIADMDFPPAPAISDAIGAYVAGGDLGYPDWPPPDPLADAFAQRMTTRYGWAPEPEHGRTVTDVLNGLELTLHLALAPGDAVALFTPAYPPFLRSLPRAGLRAVELPLHREAAGWRFDPDGVGRLLRAGDVRALVHVNPHNPTGKVFDAAEQRDLAELAEEQDLLVVADEIWADLVLDPLPHLPFAAQSEALAGRTVTLSSPSKAFNLAGLRAAVAHIGPARIRERLDDGPSHLFGLVSVLSVAAARAAWTDPGADAWLAQARAVLVRNRDRVMAAVGARPDVDAVSPSATYLAWLDLRSLGRDDPCCWLRDEVGIALAHGPDFGTGGPGHARLNFATSAAVLDQILDRLSAALDQAGSRRSVNP